MSQANMRTGSNPDSEPAHTIVCIDPENPGKPCPICNGLGVYTPDVPIDDARFGKFIRCPNNPVNRDNDRQERLRKLSNLGSYANKRFEDFQINVMYSERDRQSLQQAFDRATSYAESPQGWLVFEGTYGCGKTHLAAAIGNHRLSQGDMVLFITVPDLLDHLRAAYSPNADATYDELFDRVRDATVLILDDLGTENPSAWAQEKLFQLLNYRYVNRKFTIITTNTSVDELDARIRSRLLDTEIVSYVKITAPDYRNARDTEDPLLVNLELYRDMTFDSFDTHKGLLMEEQNNLRKAVQIAASYAENPRGWLVFMGTYGSGKTHLAASIANYRKHVGDDVMFVTMPDLLDYFRTTFAPGATTTFDGRFNKVRTVPLLVLDDVAMESASAWAKEKLFQLLDYRYVAKLPTVITTSKAMEVIDERLASRILDHRLCMIFAIKAPAYAVRLKRG